jgi:NAD(P)-dependent dehydrogenase (short-subunit alcohol dehydrogenase family)
MSDPSASSDRAPLGAGSTTDEVLEGVDLSGRVAVVTGASGGLGLETARALGAHGAEVVVAARDPEKVARALGSLHELVPDGSSASVLLDLASLEAVRRAAAEIAQRYPRIDLLIDNAGVMAAPLDRTADGFESQFGTNHLGHFLLTTLLHDQLVAGAPSRVVVLSSAGHRFADVRWDDPNWIERPDEYFNWTSYGQAKTANALFALELDRRWAAEGVHAFSVHPGVILTDLGRHMQHEDFEFMAANRPPGELVFKSVEQGAATTVWAATAPELDAHGGAYLEDCGVAATTDDPAASAGVRTWARDPDAARRLWDLSLDLVGEPA